MAVYDQSITDAAVGGKTFRNDTYVLKFTVRDGPTSSDTAIDISGYSFTFRVEDLRGNQILEKSTPGGGVTITGAANGKVEVEVQKTELDSFGALRWELEGTSSSGQVKTVADGSWDVSKDLIT